MTNLPTARDLKKLCLRATIACALRATQRVEPLLVDIPAAANNGSSVSDRRIFKISLLLVKSFCDDTLHGDSTRLAAIMEDAKWDPDKENALEIRDPVLRSGNNTFSAAMHARFGHFVTPEIPTFSTARKVIELVYQSLVAALEASVAAGDQYWSSFLEETWRDYELLFARSTALFPEYGPPIDTTANGPLGPLWRGVPPSRASPIDRENGNPEASTANEGQAKGLDATKPTSTEGQSSADRVSFTNRTEPLSPEEGYLYKYVSFETLMKVLENSTLRFSHVSDFNDPFDGQLLPVRKFGWNQFFGALRDEVARLVTTKDESIYELPNDIPTEAAISAAAQLVMEFLQSDGSVAISPKLYDDPQNVEPLSKLLRPMIYLAQQGRLGATGEALRTLNGLLDLFEYNRVPFSLHDADRRMIAALADVIQVLCLSDVSDSLLMWSHYAEQHTGAVLKFDTHSEKAGYFTTARPVIYEEELPGCEQPCTLVRRYLGLPVDTDNWMSRQFFTKSVEWAYEKEWRVMANAEIRAQGEFIPFHPEALAAIYLGCRMTTTNIRNVLDLVVDKQYAADVYVAVKDDIEFALSFVPLLNGRARTSAIPEMDISERENLYRWCLDAYFDFWNYPGDDIHGELRRLRSEGVLADYGPPNSKGLFREMIQKLQETYAAKPTISADKEKQPEEYEKQYVKILQPSVKAYGALEDALEEDLAARGGTLPEHREPNELSSA